MQQLILTQTLQDICKAPGLMMLSFILSGIMFSSLHAAELQWSGNVSLEGRSFFQKPLFAEQHNGYVSLSAEPELYIPFDGNDLALTVTPFFRIDQHDNERSHFDLREFFLFFTDTDWEWRIGINKVFWGVTESQHLVDIINQTDQVENIDGEDKLGQPMISATWIQGWGVMELFIMPYFRERTFSGIEGRLRTPLVVDVDSVQYESADAENHLDVALRWSGVVKDDWDLGIYYFNGTSREPQLIPEARPTGPVLIPRYNLIEQLGFQVQGTFESWLLKFEAIIRHGKPENHQAATGGFEYTFYSVMESSVDIGTLLEYHYDSRGEEASSPFQNDIFVGMRLAFNDTQSTDLLLGGSFDLDTDASFYRLEGSRRLGQSWKLSAAAQLFDIADSQNLQYPLRDDDYLELTLGYYF